MSVFFVSISTLSNIVNNSGIPIMSISICTKYHPALLPRPFIFEMHVSRAFCHWNNITRVRSTPLFLQTPMSSAATSSCASKQSRFTTNDSVSVIHIYALFIINTLPDTLFCGDKPKPRPELIFFSLFPTNTFTKYIQFCSKYTLISEDLASQNLKRKSRDLSHMIY